MSELGTLEWVKNSFQSEFDAFIKTLKADVQKSFKQKEVLYWNFQNYSAADELKDALDRTCTVDRTNDIVAHKVYKLLFKKIVPLLDFVRDYRETSLKDLRSGYHRKRISGMYRYAKTITRYNNALHGIEPGILTTYVASLSGTAVTTPNDDTVYEQTQYTLVNSLIYDIRTLRTVCLESRSTPEEEYFLEQIVTSYIPAVVKGAAAVANASPEVNQQAEKNFIRQLKLVRTKLQELVEKNSLAALKEVEAQTEFLTTKFEEKPVNQALTLGKGSSAPKSLPQRSTKVVDSLGFDGRPIRSAKKYPAGVTSKNTVLLGYQNSHYFHEKSWSD